jgi:hypothetical protein
MRYLLLFLSATCFGELVDGYATVTNLVGSGFIEVNGKDGPIQKDARATASNRLKTDKATQADIILSNGIKLILTENSTVLLKTLKQTAGTLQPPSPDNKSFKELGPSLVEVEVETGKVIGDVKKLVPMSVFTLKTPVGVVSIKGTVFSVEFKKDKDGNAVFNVGCLVGRVVVQMADPKIAPMNVPAGKQLSLSAPPPPPPGQPGDKPNSEQKAPPPMKMEITTLPPTAMAGVKMDIPPPPPAPAGPPPPPPASATALDRVIQETANAVMKEQVNPSPTGG